MHANQAHQIIDALSKDNPYNAPTYQPLGRWDGIFHYIPPSF